MRTGSPGPGPRQAPSPAARIADEQLAHQSRTLHRPGTRLRPRARVAELAEQVPRGRLEPLEILLFHLRSPVSQPGGDRTPGLLGAQAGVVSLAALVEPQHVIVVGHSEEIAERLGLAGGIGDQPFVEELVYRPGPSAPPS